MHQLVALVNAKLSPTDSAFASLTEICLTSLLVQSTESRWGGNEPSGLDPWLEDLEQVCEAANVKIHYNGGTTSIEGPSWGSNPCSYCHSDETGSLDSAPVVTEVED